MREANRPGNGGLRTESNLWEHLPLFWTGSRNAPYALRRAMLPVVEIVRIHTNPKRKRGNGLATSLALRVSVSRNRGQYSSDSSRQDYDQGAGDATC